MQTFKDSSGKKWTIALNIGIAEKVCSECNIDLIDGDMGIVVVELIQKSRTRLDVIWLMMEPSDRTRDDFNNSLDQATLNNANEAFWAELKSFTQSLDETRGQAITELIPTARAETLAQTKVICEIATSETAVNMMREQLTKATEKLSGVSLDSSELPASTT